LARKPKQLHFSEVELTKGGGEGHAIARINGKVVFVKYGAPGDVADIRIIGRKKKYSLAKITHLHKASEMRQEPFCEHYGLCGGCRWQHIQYAEQAKLKEQWAQDCLQRIGHVEVEEYLPIVASADTKAYRNKMEYTFSNKRWLYEDEVLEELPHTNALGFHAPGRFDKVIDINQCHLQVDKGNEIRNFVRAYCLENEMAFYDLKEHTGLVRTLMLRNTVNDDWMINVAFAREDAAIEGLLNAINTAFKPASLNYAINTKLNDSIYDLDFKTYAGEYEIKETLMGLQFFISPKSFFQTNTKQAEKLYQVAIDFAGLTQEDVVYDLYCGTGTITCVAAQQAKQAIGVEIVPEAIDAAKRNAQLNALENTAFVVGDMRDVFNESFYRKHGKPDVIITDPPRSGMHPKVVKYLNEIACPKVVYVSCNPATQARDLEVLSERYRVVKSQPVDMFPQTHHVENVVLLELK
jgi:23S rRNA (uracil1939-C5)-methyltransferase